MMGAFGFMPMPALSVRITPLSLLAPTCFRNQFDTSFVIELDRYFVPSYILLIKSFSATLLSICPITCKIKKYLHWYICAGYGQD